MAGHDKWLNVPPERCNKDEVHTLLQKDMYIKSISCIYVVLSAMDVYFVVFKWPAMSVSLFKVCHHLMLKPMSECLLFLVIVLCRYQTLTWYYNKNGLGMNLHCFILVLRSSCLWCSLFLQVVPTVYIFCSTKFQWWILTEACWRRRRLCEGVA